VHAANTGRTETVTQDIYKCLGYNAFSRPTQVSCTCNSAHFKESIALWTVKGLRWRKIKRTRVNTREIIFNNKKNDDSESDDNRNFLNIFVCTFVLFYPLMYMVGCITARTALE
jgi:hypothetical protein